MDALDLSSNKSSGSKRNTSVNRSSVSHTNRPYSIYQHSSMAPKLSGQNCKFLEFLLSLNSQKRLWYKENNTKYRCLSWKPRSHVRILIYRTRPIGDWLRTTKYMQFQKLYKNYTRSWLHKAGSLFSIKAFPKYLT